MMSFSPRCLIRIAVLKLLFVHGARITASRNAVPRRFPLPIDRTPWTGTNDARGSVRCCCLGPSDVECRLLLPSQQVASMKDERRLVCPSYLGYQHYDKFDFKAIPEPCGSTSNFTQRNIKVKVKAYWMRHGWSCANTLEAQSNLPNISVSAKFQSNMRSLYADPSLTDLAVVRANALGLIVRDKILTREGKPPRVFSSPMVRAMETAMYNFPGWGTRPIPYIAETGVTLDNSPVSWSRQKTSRLLRSPNNESSLKDFIFDVNRVNHPDRSSMRKSNYEAFRRYMPAILNKLLKEDDLRDGYEVPVIIVGHSNYMKHFLECGQKLKRKPRNNEVWVQSYDVNLGSYNALLQPSGCEELLDPQMFPPPPTTLCESDIERCAPDGSKFKPTAWLTRDQEECDAMPSTSIFDRDIQAKEAYIGSLHR